MGSQVPSERVAPDYTASDGLDAAKLVRIGGTVLDPWQSDILDDWLGRTPSGKWAAPSAGGSVPRQNGKSLLIQARSEAGMLLYNEQVVYTAHLQKTATETFEEMRDFFEGPKLRRHVAEIKTAIGREQIILKSGARIKFLARTRNGGRGQHGDLLIFDEAQELDETQQASFLPAISASLNPQTLYLGTPPDENADGTVFRRIRTGALDGTAKRTAWFEYSVKEIGDIHDPARWAAANPALGRRIQQSTIEGEAENMAPDTFARERLGWWSPVVTEKLDYALDKNAWDRCASDDEKPEGKTAYGVKFAADGSAVCLCGAVIPKDGPARVSLIEMQPTGRGFGWLADWLNVRYDRASCVVIDGRNGVDVLVDRIKGSWRARNSVIRPSAKETSQSYGQTGKTITNQSVGERSITVTGAILRDLDANEALLKKLVRPLTAGRWCKTVGSTVWYLDVVPAQTPIVSGGANLLNFQFKLKAAFPYWRTEDTARMLLGGMEPAWFPTPVSTAGTFAISRYKHNMYTNFVNDGNAETAFTLYLQAAAKVKNPMLWNNGTRIFIRLNTTMQAHERAVICTADGNRGCRYYTAAGAEDNGFRLLDIDSDLWMMLTPGDNVLRMTADEGNENLTAIVTAPKGVASGV